MRSAASLRSASLLGLLVILLAPTGGILAQDAQVVVLTDGPIPEADYETWSVFLICNPTWLRPDSNQDLVSLYKDFWAFGDFIGERHLAIWFGKTAQPDVRDLAASLDLERNARFCSKFNLKASETPHVLVTDRYQVLVDSIEEVDSTAEGTDVARVDIIKFNGRPPSEVEDALDLLVAKVRNRRDAEPTPDSPHTIWDVFRGLVEGASSVVLALSDDVSVTFDMKFVKVTVD